MSRAIPPGWLSALSPTLAERRRVEQPVPPDLLAGLREGSRPAPAELIGLPERLTETVRIAEARRQARRKRDHQVGSLLALFLIGMSAGLTRFAIGAAFPDSLFQPRPDEAAAAPEDCEPGAREGRRLQASARPTAAPASADAAFVDGGSVSGGGGGGGGGAGSGGAGSAPAGGSGEGSGGSGSAGGSGYASGSGGTGSAPAGASGPGSGGSSGRAATFGQPQSGEGSGAAPDPHATPAAAVADPKAPEAPDPYGELPTSDPSSPAPLDEEGETCSFDAPSSFGAVRPSPENIGPGAPEAPTGPLPAPPALPGGDRPSKEPAAARPVARRAPPPADDWKAPARARAPKPKPTPPPTLQDPVSTWARALAGQQDESGAGCDPAESPSR